MNFADLVTVPAITAICYLIGMLFKALPMPDKFIPVGCGFTGAILGVVAYFIQMPSFTAEDPITAVALGIVSGLAATGINQIFKQLKKDKEEDFEA